MISMSKRAAKGSRWDTVRLWGPGCFVLGKNSLNCLNPNAVRILMIFVSCEKSKYKDWFKGKVTVLLSSVVLIWLPE